MYDSSTTSILLKGNSYNRGIRAHNIALEAMFRLQWHAMELTFIQWLYQQGDSRVDETLVIKQVIPGGFWFYIADVDHLSETHPAVHEEFMSGNLSISRSTQPFAQVWSDMAL